MEIHYGYSALVIHTQLMDGGDDGYTRSIHFWS